MRTPDISERTSDAEIERYIERNIEYAADAAQYGGPAYAKPYLDDIRKLMEEQNRRMDALFR